MKNNVFTIEEYPIRVSVLYFQVLYSQNLISRMLSWNFPGVFSTFHDVVGVEILPVYRMRKLG